MIGLQAHAGLLFVAPGPGSTFSGGPSWLGQSVYVLILLFSGIASEANPLV